HLLCIINDILDVSKIEAGKLELHESLVDLDILIDDVMRLVHERAERAGIALQRDSNPDEISKVYVDSRKIKQVLLNLLSNSIKFPPSGARVMVARQQTADGGLNILIRDTGIGIAAEHISLATSRFGQVDSSMTRRYSGTGLGLPLTIGLVELHQGKLSIESEVAKGTVVTVGLPPERCSSHSRQFRSKAG